LAYAVSSLQLGGAIEVFRRSDAFGAALSKDLFGSTSLRRPTRPVLSAT
jgi:hypothetical protein